jgi:hypothetical protein
LPPLAALLSPCPRVGTFHSYFERSRVYGLFHSVLQREFLGRIQGALTAPIALSGGHDDNDDASNPHARARISSKYSRS